MKKIWFPVCVVTLSCLGWYVLTESDRRSSLAKNIVSATDSGPYSVESHSSVQSTTNSTAGHLNPPPVFSNKGDELPSYETLTSTLPDIEEARTVSNAAEPVALWEVIEKGKRPVGLPENVEVAYIRTDPKKLEEIMIGQFLSLPIPQEARSYYGTVQDTRNQLNGEVKIWSGTLDNVDALSNFTVTRGQVMTYVTVTTGSNLYQIEINNSSGQGSVLDSQNLNEYRNPEDGIPAPEIKIPTPKTNG